MDDVLCSACNTPIPNESTSSVPTLEQRNPCPKCGSKSRIVNISGAVVMRLTATATLTLIHHSGTLLDEARSLFAAGKYALTVMVAQTACEVAMSRALSVTYINKGMGSIEEALGELLDNSNPHNGKVHKWFKALTGEHLPSQPWWKDLGESVKRRNQIVHKGANATKDEAEESLKVATEVVKYLREFG